MSGSLFGLRNVTLPASRGRQSPDDTAVAAAKHNQGVNTPRSPVARLNSITLEIPCGATAVVGLSGAGKTSLLNVLAGFETGFSGELILASRGCQPPDEIFTKGLQGTNQGTDVPCSPKKLPLYWVPQSGGLWPHLSVEQHVEIVGSVAGHSVVGQKLEPTKECSATSVLAPNQYSSAESGRFSKSTDEILQLFDLTHRRQALPAELSQGERSRLALARALATRASVLLLDEPLSHVDPVRKPTYWNIVRRIVAEENISMVFTSHEPETVLRHAEHVICLHDGAVVFEGPVRMLYDHPPDARVGAFLGPLNWFQEEEASVFLKGNTTSSAVAIRPERIQIRMAKDSAIELLSTPFVGVYQESIVRDVASGMTKSVLHQVPEVAILNGNRVAIRVHPQPGGMP